MLAEPGLAEYLEEIHRHVCSHCVERPPSGPPCGKGCGIEMHLPELIETIHQEHSELIEPYLRHDYLAVLVVEAVKAVDERHAAENCPL